MATLAPFQVVNGRKAYVVSLGVTVNAASVVYSFPNTRVANRPYIGPVYVNLAQAVPEGTTATLPVLFDGTAVTKYGGQPLTVADLSGTGVYQLWFDRGTGVLQIQTGIVQPTGTGG